MHIRTRGLYTCCVTVWFFNGLEEHGVEEVCVLRRGPISFLGNAISSTMKIIHQIKVQINPVLTIGCYHVQFQLNYFCI